MQFATLHSWDLSPTGAVALQRELANRIDTRTPLTHCDLIAAADVSYGRFSNRFFAGVVVMRMADLTIVEKKGAMRESPFPYVPGLLSFREAPVLLEAFAKLECELDAIMIEGQGFAHPRRIGIASHLGLWLDRPTVGCAKSVLVGEFKEPRRRAGSLAPLMHKGEVIGSVVRTKDGVKPVYVSVGHKIDLPSAVRLVLTTKGKYRIPEPTRQAHLYANALRRGEAAVD